METALFQALAAGGDVFTIVIGIVLFRHDRRISFLEWKVDKADG